MYSPLLLLIIILSFLFIIAMMCCSWWLNPLCFLNCVLEERSKGSRIEKRMSSRTEAHKLLEGKNNN